MRESLPKVDSESTALTWGIVVFQRQYCTHLFDSQPIRGARHIIIICISFFRHLKSTLFCEDSKTLLVSK